MRRVLFAFCSLVVVAGVLSAQSPAESPPRDAGAIVDEMMSAMGGPDGWEHARYLRFDINQVTRSYLARYRRAVGEKTD